MPFEKELSEIVVDSIISIKWFQKFCDCGFINLNGFDTCPQCGANLTENKYDHIFH